MLTVETAVFPGCIWLHKKKIYCYRKGQSYPVKYYLELVEEYSRGKIHKSETEPGNENVNTVYFVNQAKGNTWISHTEFVYNEWARDCKCLVIFELPA